MNVKKYKELKEKAENIILKDFSLDAVLEVPLFGNENNELFLQYLGIKFKEEKVKRTRLVDSIAFLRQDMRTGEVLEVKNVVVSESILLDEKLLKDENGIFFDYSKFINKEFLNWKRNLVKKLKNKDIKDTNPLYNEKLLKINGDLVSPKEYILNNFEKVFNQMNNILDVNFERNLNEGVTDFLESIIIDIRDKYLYSNVIDYALIKQYMNYVKCLWPSLIEILKKDEAVLKFLDDEEFDNLLEDYNMAKRKTN